MALAAPEPGMGEGDPEDPSWVAENAALRERMDLPAYAPPQFEDGTPIHQVISELEATHDVSILLLGVDTEAFDPLEVRIDGEPAFDLDRTRTGDGNTVYLQTAADFRDAVREALSTGST